MLILFYYILMNIYYLIFCSHKYINIICEFSKYDHTQNVDKV